MEKLVDIKITNFPLQFWGLYRDATLLVVDRAASVAEVLEDFRQLDDGLPNVEKIRRVIR